MALVYRLVKGSSLTYAEGDGNFSYLLTTMSGSAISITGPTTVTGTLTITSDTFTNGKLVLSSGATGSLLGTASYANYATTASYLSGSAANATSASYATQTTSASYSLQATSASYALQATSASYATTASYVRNAALFPFTGSAIISGSLLVTGSLLTLGDNVTSGSITATSFVYGQSAGLNNFPALKGITVGAYNTVTEIFDLISYGTDATIGTTWTFQGYSPVTSSSATRFFITLPRQGGVLMAISGASAADTAIPRITGAGANAYLINSNISDSGALINLSSATNIIGNTNVTGSLTISGSIRTSGSFVVSGSLWITATGSFVFPLTSSGLLNPIPTGSAFWSGSFLYIYNGTAYRSASFS